MIDFNNANFPTLRSVSNDAFADVIYPLLVQGEMIVDSFKGIRDGVVFTTHRIIIIDVRGVSGRQKDFTVLPYNKITAFSIETAGVLDIDNELEIYFSTLGAVHFQFIANADVTGICRTISQVVL